MSRFNHVSINEGLAGSGGVILFAGLFFKWYALSSTISVNGVVLSLNHSGSDVSGWHSLTWGRWVFSICAVAAIGLVAMQARGLSPNVSIDPWFALAVLGGLSTLWIVLRILSPPAEHLSVRLGLLVGLIGAVLVAGGAWRRTNETFSDEHEA